MRVANVCNRSVVCWLAAFTAALASWYARWAALTPSCLAVPNAINSKNPIDVLLTPRASSSLARHFAVLKSCCVAEHMPQRQRPGATSVCCVTPPHTDLCRTWRSSQCGAACSACVDIRWCRGNAARSPRLYPCAPASAYRGTAWRQHETIWQGRLCLSCTFTLVPASGSGPHARYAKASSKGKLQSLARTAGRWRLHWCSGTVSQSQSDVILI